MRFGDLLPIAGVRPTHACWGRSRKPRMQHGTRGDSEDAVAQCYGGGLVARVNGCVGLWLKPTAALAEGEFSNASVAAERAGGILPRSYDRSHHRQQPSFHNTDFGEPAAGRDVVAGRVAGVLGLQLCGANSMVVHSSSGGILIINQ